MHSLEMLLGIATFFVGFVVPRMVYAIPLDQFYDYGTAYGDSVLPRSHNGASSAIFLNSTDFYFFANNQTTLFVNNNGVISFGENMTVFASQPNPFPGNDTPFLSPYWADVDTRPVDGGSVYYRQTTNQSLLIHARNHIRNVFPNDFPSFTPTWLFIATWYRVGYYDQHTDRTNTFQSVLMSDGTYSFVSFLYADGLIQWTTGDASGGSGGLGGSPAHCGFDAGDGTSFLSHPNSGTAAILNIASTTNVGVFGLWTFRVDWTFIIQPDGTDREFMSGSNPHFAIRLPGGALLCYNFQGLHNTTFNLLGNDHLQINAFFVPDATDYDNTWLGSIGVIALHSGKKMTTLQFTAADQLVRIGEGIQLDAKTIKRLSFNKGYLSILKLPSNHTQRYPRVQVEFIDSKLSFTVGFTKNNHLDLYWHSTGERSTGVVGQFFRTGVKIDVAAQLLHVPGHPPVPVKKRDLWKFMSKSLLGDHQCWMSAYPSSQGAGIVAGTYEDYIVDGLLAVGQ